MDCKLNDKKDVQALKQKESYITYAAILHVDLHRAILHISMTAYYITAYKRQ